MEDTLKIRHLTPRARISATVGVIAVGALALSGCAGDSGSANYVEGGTFVYALGTDIGSLDPALGVTSAALAVGQYAYDPLVHLNEEGTDPRPSICPLLERYDELAATRLQLQPPAGSDKPVRFVQCRAF